MAKRSPILGYNHNVKYRGLIFHVQTEDSGLGNPHLFTHLFYEGVIISTRKLVYDAGSAEDAIKGLMQAQHKVVLKDLKSGKFDDKIDVYLANIEGLEPRTSAPSAGSVAEVPDLPGPPPLTDIDIGYRPSDPEIELTADEPTPPPQAVRPPVARTQTAERKSAPTRVGSPRTHAPPPPMDLDPPTDIDTHGIVNATVRTAMPEFDSQPEIQIFGHPRPKHDTEVQSDGVPGAIGQQPSGAARAPGDSIPPLPSAQDRRPNALAAGALPPARPVTRPPSRQAMAPPTVVSRPLSSSDGERNRNDSDAVEVYAPAPPSADAPPGMERPGQYAQHKKASQRLPADAIKQPPSSDRSGAIPIPSGLSRPGRQPTSQPAPMSGAIPPVRTPTPSSELRVPDLQSRPIERPRTPTPPRISPASSPVTGRAPSTGSGGVVMTRPAVIVGAPAKQTVPPRVRKAREEEGRGFGQGLISEKSLDEVILAYLSEDADEK